MQSRQNIFLLLTFLYFGNKWLFFSWNVLGALTQQETSHQCKSPSLPSGLRWPARVQRWRETPTRGKGGLAWSCKLFYLCAFRIAPYFPTIFISASFHPWEWDSHVKGFPRAACQGTQAREAFCIEASLICSHPLPLRAASVIPLTTRLFCLSQPFLLSARKDGNLPFSQHVPKDKQIILKCCMEKRSTKVNPAGAGHTAFFLCKGHNLSSNVLCASLSSLLLPRAPAPTLSSRQGSRAACQPSGFFQPFKHMVIFWWHLAKGTVFLNQDEKNPQILSLLHLQRFLQPSCSTSVSGRTRKSLSLSDNHYFSWFLPCI